MSNYIRPQLVENKSKDWVLNGRNNSFFQYIIDRYNGSVTNSAIINSYIDLIIGRGLVPQGKASNETTQNWVEFKQLLSKKDLRKIVSDFQLFGEASMQIIKKRGGGISSIYHIPKEKVVPQIADEDGEIKGYFYCDDWSRISQNKPEYFPAFGEGSKTETEIYCIKPYKAGKDYFSDPDYISGLQYCLMEEEISNYHVSHIQNGLSFGYIINIPNGASYTTEEKDDLERKIKQKLTGSSNAGKFIISFNGVDAEITVTSIENNDAHKQWQFLVQESRQQIMTAHRVTSPMLFGIKDNTGFGNNAEELDTAEGQLMKRVIAPKQEYVINALEDILGAYNINLDLKFLPLTEEKTLSVQTEMSSDCSCKKKIEFASDELIDKLIALGEDIGDDWEVLDERRCDEITLTEQSINKVFEFASVPKTSDKKDVQDTSLFKIRYRYAGSKVGERDFCNKVLKADKVYRSEDLNANYNYNEDLAPSGKDSYNIFLYKGGVNCKHWWERVVYLKKNNDKISVNKARKMILELEPSERKDAEWVKNPKEVAQIAESQNNYWSLKPNYRQ